MVQIASFAVVATILASQAAASTTCVPGQKYCGFILLGGKDDDFKAWKARVDQALHDAGQPADPTHEWGSLFRCLTPTTIKFEEFCSTKGCQPASNNACDGKNECCGRV
ncbi:hypothetical protein V8F33_007837 [Rhypophila sp. PSN 637]